VKPEIKLSPRELLFIASLLDATEFMGVSDAFFGMENVEIQQELVTLQTSLEKKGYAEMDFDGSFALKDEVRDIVDICANCDAFIVVDKCKSGQPQLRNLYYAKRGQIVKLCQDANDNSLMFMPSIDGMLEDILQGVKWQAYDTSMLKDVKITNQILADVKAKAADFDETNSVKILMENGCDELSAKTITSGLIGKLDYFAVIITVFEGEREGVHNIMLISDKNGIYRLLPIIGEEQDVVHFNALVAQEAKVALAEVVRNAFSPESEGFL